MTNDGADARVALAERLRRILAEHPIVREIRMFGGIAFMVNERLALSAGEEGDLLVRTDPNRRDELLGLGALPAAMGRRRLPMGPGWMTVPSERLHEDDELRFWVTVGVGG